MGAGHGLEMPCCVAPGAHTTGFTMLFFRSLKLHVLKPAVTGLGRVGAESDLHLRCCAEESRKLGHEASGQRLWTSSEEHHLEWQLRQWSREEPPRKHLHHHSMRMISIKLRCTGLLVHVECCLTGRTASFTVCRAPVLANERQSALDLSQ